MSYEPTEWKTGDVVTSEKLNKIEEGVADSSPSLIVNLIQDGDDHYLDKTWQEIYDAFLSGRLVYYIDELKGSAYEYNGLDELWCVYYSSSAPKPYCVLFNGLEVYSDSPNGRLS